MLLQCPNVDSKVSEKAPALHGALLVISGIRSLFLLWRALLGQTAITKGIIMEQSSP